jgi:hypothetical protein
MVAEDEEFTDTWQLDAQAAYDEALRRVERARAKPEVTSINLKLPALNRLPPLAGLANIKRLRVNGTKIRNFDAVRELTGLEYLNISTASINDLQFVESLIDLKRLVIAGTNIWEITPLAKLGSLRQLDISRNEILDVSPLADLTQLVRLSLAATRVADIDALENLYFLEHLDCGYCPISDLSPLTNLAALRRLLLRKTRVQQLMPIARLQLHKLDLRGTPVEDIAPLGEMHSLRRLDIAATRVRSLSALRYLEPDALNFSNTPVTDLSPLANCLSLIAGAKNRLAPGGLIFNDCPITDPKLLSLSKEPNPERTIETIYYLREQQGLAAPTMETVEDWQDIDYDEDDTDPAEIKESVPNVDIIPQQSATAIYFTSAVQGPLAIAPDRAELSVDPEQLELYARLRRQLNDILHDFPTQEIGQIAVPIDDFLKQPATWTGVRYKKVLWLCGNALRYVIAQHDSVADDPDPHYAKLPPVLAEGLRRSVETWNVVVLGDTTLRQVDAQRLGPQEREHTTAQLELAEPVIEAAVSNRLITNSEAATAIEKTLAQANVTADNIHKKQAEILARETSQNLVGQILRGAHRIAADLCDPRTDEARNFAKAYKAGIYNKLGQLTVAGSAAVAMSAGATAIAGIYFYATPFFDFVVTQAPLLKAYLAIAFQNPQLVQMIDSMIAIRNKILKS